MNRALLTGLAISVYVAAINVWIYLLANGMLTTKENRLSSYAINGLMILFCYVDVKTITHVPHHEDFNNIAFICILSNFIFNILNHLGMLSDPVKMFITFNGLIFVVTSLILFWGRKHGLFNE